MSSTSAIDDKSDMKTDNDGGKKNNWGSFALTVVHSFIVIIVFAVIGCNWIYMANNDALDLIFPTEIKDYLIFVPHSEPPSGGGRRRSQKGGNGNTKNSYTCKPSMCSGNKGINMPNVDIMERMGYGEPMNKSFPYNLWNGNEDTGFGWEGFKNWFARSEAASFIMYRKYMKNLFPGGEKSEIFKELVPDWAMFLIANILVLFHLHIIIPGVSFLTSIASLFMGGNYFWAYILIGLIFQYNIFMIIANVAMQFLSAAYYFLLAPLVLDYKGVTKIFRCNFTLISFLFGAMCVGSAFLHLENSTSMMMMVAYIVLAIKACFF